MKNTIASISLAVVLALGLGVIGCTSEYVPEITEYNLAVSSTEGGSVTSPGEGIFMYDEGTDVALVAVADEGYQFVNWTGDVGEIADVKDATTTITMKDDYSITAKFAVKQYGLITSSTEGGSVTTPGKNAYTYDKGEVVNLAAVADEGYQFINWTGDVSTIVDVNAASTTITMNGGYSITANFAGAIRDWYDLDAIRNNLDGSYILMNDLDSDIAGYTELASPTANGGKGWEPIGSLVIDPVYEFMVDSVDPFSGSLDGQGCEVRDLFINRPDEDGVGLFGCVGGGDTIENLGVLNAEVTGHDYVGSLMGEHHDGTVSNSYSTGIVTGEYSVGGLVGYNRWGGYLSNSYSTVSITSDRAVGGLTGENDGTVSNSYSSGRVTGTGSVGGLAGENWGNVRDCYATGSVTGALGGVGGLVGWNWGGSVNNCYFTGSVNADNVVGGLVGENRDGTVSNSYYSYDEVLINGRNIVTIGALSYQDFDQWLANDKFLDVNERLSKEDGYYVINNVNDFKELLVFGQDDSLKFRLTNDLDLDDDPNFYIPYLGGEFDGNGHKISNLNLSLDLLSQVGLFGYLASGAAVTGVGAENVNIIGHGSVGGLVGEIDGTVSDSYCTGKVAGHWSIGGLVGRMGVTGGTVSNSYYNHDAVLINDRHIITIGALFNEDFEQWLANDRFLDVNERLSQEDGYYLINDVSDFKQLLAFGQDDSLKFRLTNDLDLATQFNLYIPYLAGEFDGDGHKISNLRLHLESVVDQVGLFGCLASGAEVSEVGLEDVNVTATVFGNQYVGGLVGGSFGMVSNSYSSGTVTSETFVGGLVGWNSGTVSNSYSTAAVTGSWAVGGLAGTNAEGTVINSYSSGIVTSEAPVGGVGGLVGQRGGPVHNSFWDIETSGQGTSHGGTGKTIVEMHDITTFTDAGWNITEVANPGACNLSYIWNMVNGATYPFLSWEHVS